ncbi:MAG: DUF234 domain-containing protein [Candidatus Thermoplasmatota archaeon]|nr:DUF234 domain-containing protein [Candidatus Thermoplasmatota archaeon]
MPSIGFLRKLDQDDLEEIVKKEGLKSIPKNYDKDDIIKFLEGTLTTEKVKKYREMYFEKETERDIHIHEKIKEIGIQNSSVDFEKTRPDRNATVIGVFRAKPTKLVIELIAKYVREDMPTARGFEFYNELGDKTLRMLYDIFVERLPDVSGASFEFLCADFLVDKWSEIERVERDYYFPKIGKIDIVGFDNRDLPVVIAECKDTKVSYDKIDKWIHNSIEMTKEYGEQLKKTKWDDIQILQSYFFTSRGFSQGVVDRVKKNRDIEDESYVVNKSVLKSRRLEFVPYMYDVRDGKFYQEF